MDTASTLALVGSAFALAGVVVGGLLAAATQRRHWRYTEQVTASAAFLAEYASVYAGFASAARSGALDGQKSTAGVVDWVPFNEALDRLNLVADARVAAAAHQLDEALWHLGLLLRRGAGAGHGWAEGREPVDAARLQFVNAVRGALGAKGGDLARLHGRPRDSDPVWKAPTTPRSTSAP